MTRDITPKSPGFCSPSVAVVGQCSFTSYVVRYLLRSGIPIALVVLAPVSAERDPFEGLNIPGDPVWFREHRHYHGGWRRVLREECYAQDVPLRETIDIFADDLHTDVLLVAGLAQRVPDSILSRFGAAALNAHPSLLPSFAGPQPEAQVLLHGARRSGITIHTMTHQFDRGPIRHQSTCLVPEDATVGSLERRGAALVARGMMELLKVPVTEWPIISS